MKISVFGLGYVGVVSAACLAEDQHFVIGVDPNKVKADLVAQGRAPVIEKRIDELIARVVACVRDLRDFMVSYRDQWKKSSDWESDRLKRIYQPVLTSLLWRSSINALMAARKCYRERIFVNRYETLVSDPESQVRAICDFIGEDFQSSMTEVSSDNSSADQKSAGIFKSSVGRWRGQLSSADVVLAHRVCRRQLSAVGYPLEPVPQIRLPLLTAPSALPTSHTGRWPQTLRNAVPYCHT